MQSKSAASTQSEVHIRVDDDADATRITVVLEALGYRVIRRLDDADGPTRLGWAVERMSSRYRLTTREREVLAGVLDGASNDRLAAQLGLSRATVKWHLHNVFAKTNASNREALLRAALDLGGHADPHWASPHDATVEID
jgi:DNA-binding CsgD family transcriptional regulator